MTEHEINARYEQDTARGSAPDTETLTRCWIQIHSTVIPRWTDLDNQLTDGYDSVEQARKALTGGWWDLDRLKGTLGGEVRFRVVERTVIETAFEI